jgi:hypothetical protein
VITFNEIEVSVWPGANVTVPELGLNAAGSPIDSLWFEKSAGLLVVTH